MQHNDKDQLNIEAENTPVEEGAFDQQAEPYQSGDTSSSIQVDSAGSAQQKRKIAKFWDILLWVLIAVLAVAVLIRVFVTRVTIDGASMEPTYHSENVVWVNRFGKPSRGDVAVFYKHPIDSKFKAMFARGADVSSGGKYEKLIKRVVAVEGDSIWVEQTEGGYRLVVKSSSGEVFHEDYYTKGKEAISEDTFVMSYGVLDGLANLTEDNPLVIEQGHFFAMGDNRGNSEDSRGELGQVPLDRLFGIVINK